MRLTMTMDSAIVGTVIFLLEDALITTQTHTDSQKTHRQPQRTFDIFRMRDIHPITLTPTQLLNQTLIDKHHLLYFIDTDTKLQTHSQIQTQSQPDTPLDIANLF